MNFYQYTYEQLKEQCDGAALLYNWHYKKNRRESCEHNNLSKLTRRFRANLSFSLPQIHTVHQSADRTVKFLFALADGRRVESVLIPFQGKYTICLSSQVGCAMSCSFCYTGRQGFTRHLASHEIVGQFVEAKRWLSAHRPEDDRILNIVFMGQGEPLHNFDAVKQACEIFLSHHGLSLATHKITVSTSGYLPGLKRWRSEMPAVNIALSLHSLDPAKRARLIPLENKYPVAEIVPLVDGLPQGELRFVTYEYLLIDGFNDSDVEAADLGRCLQGRKAFVNLIPFNPFPGSEFRRPSVDRVARFKAVVDTFGVPTTIRSTKGDEILAACGQLNTRLEPNLPLQI